MLGLCSAANFITATSFLLAGNAAVMTANGYVAAVLCAVNSFRAYFGKKDAQVLEKSFVFLVFIAIGVLQYSTPLDLMPFAASMLFVLSAFQKNEQRIRIVIFFNTLILFIYSLIVGSSVAIGHAFSLISIITSYCRERKAGAVK